MRRLREASKPNLSFIMLIFFLASFVVARLFTHFFPSTVLEVQGYHVHHFWFGLALLAIGGWMGINYREESTDRIAAVIFGIGGGLVGDEIGLFATFGDYYSQLTYTFVIALIAFAFMVTLFRRHGQAIVAELYGFFRLYTDVYVALFLAIVSSAFLIQSSNLSVVVISGITLVVAIVLILRRIARSIRSRRVKQS